MENTEPPLQVTPAGTPKGRSEFIHTQLLNTMVRANVKWFSGIHKKTVWGRRSSGGLPEILELIVERKKEKNWLFWDKSLKNNLKRIEYV